MRLVLQEPPLGPLSQSYHHLLSPKNSPNCSECTKVPELLGMHRTAWFSYRHLFGTFLMKWVLICPFGEKEYSWFINYSLASGETEINIHKSRAGQLFAAASFFTNFSWVLDFFLLSGHDLSFPWTSFFTNFSLVLDFLYTRITWLQAPVSYYVIVLHNFSTRNVYWSLFAFAWGVLINID